MRQIIIATGNHGKLREFKEILADLPLELSSLRDHWSPLPEIAETGSTFAENARIKADWVFERSGVWALADDSGLEVDFLDGAPGVRSARFAGEGAGGEANNRKLLSLLDKVEYDRRTARFKCVLVLKTGVDRYYTVEGVCEGLIAREQHGDRGFGYDPLFVPSGMDRTFAELDSSIKHSISHRGKALVELRREINELI